MSEIINVCVPTYKRPELLRKLLLKLDNQKIEHSFFFSVLLVDNDKERSAELVYNDLCDKVSYKLLYLNEPKQNISLARNKALENIDGEWVAFIDDDSYPANDWLLNLFLTARTYKADLVNGPVEYYFCGLVTKHIQRSIFYIPLSYKTGYEHYRLSSTNNCMFKRKLIANENMFDLSFGLSGGEDTKFFSDLKNKNVKFCWCEEAKVFEYVPKDRANFGWMTRRALRAGNTCARIALERESIIIYQIELLIKFLIVLVSSPFILLVGLFDFRYFSFPLYRFVFYAGGLIACYGHIVYEYDFSLEDMNDLPQCDII